MKTYAMYLFISLVIGASIGGWRIYQRQSAIHTAIPIYKIDEPPIDKREITVRVLDPSVSGFEVRKFRAEAMTIGAAFDEIGLLKSGQDVTVRCEGGYNKQPPLYTLGFTLASSQGRAEIAQGMDDAASLHSLCMKKAVAHLEMLKATAPEELKYYR